MYPYHIYITDKLTGEIYKVAVNDYQQSISSNAFKNLLLNVPYNLSRKKYHNHSPYRVSYDFKYGHVFEDDEECRKLVRGNNYVEPIITKNFNDLYCFYNFIGYNKKTKKINDKTYRQFIIDRINTQEKSND